MNQTEFSKLTKHETSQLYRDGKLEIIGKLKIWFNKAELDLFNKDYLIEEDEDSQFYIVFKEIKK